MKKQRYNCYAVFRELSFCYLRFQTYQVTEGVTGMTAKLFSQVLSLRLERKNTMGFFDGKSPLHSNKNLLSFECFCAIYIYVPPVSLSECCTCTPMFMYLMLFYSLI